MTSTTICKCSIRSNSVRILAPWIQEIDQAKSTARVVVPAAIRARLSQPTYTDDREDSSRPNHATLHLAPTHSAEVGTELTDEQLVARGFGHATWEKRVQQAMEENGLIQDRRSIIDDQPLMAGSRGSRDDLCSVRIDNLPEVFEPYFVAIPRDDEEHFKRFGFIKFDRLRYALKFLEDCKRMRVENMVLNISVVM
jgi:hypothetical protein